MRQFTLLLVIASILFSCEKSENSEVKLLATFGDQPDIAINHENEIAVVFGEEESIYYASSSDLGQTFSEPILVDNLEGLVLGYSSGPQVARTSTNTVITASDRAGNIYAWTRPIDGIEWLGPVRINDIDKSAGEALSNITSTPDGRLFCVWIDTRILESSSHAETPKSNHERHSGEVPKDQDDLDEMTPIGITKRELYDQIGDIPENAHLAFHGDDNDKLYWVFLDKDGEVLKAENMEEFRKFRARNSSRVKTKGKIYFASSEDGGKTWTESKLIYRSPDGSVCECCKPSITSDANGSLFVMFRNNINGSRDLYFTKSIDSGENFSQPEKLGTGTWKINGCPMDGGDIIVDNNGDLRTIWQRKGEIFLANSSLSEQNIGSGRSPSFAINSHQSYIAYSKGEDIMSVISDNSTAVKIGTGSSPKVLALENGAIYLWVNEKGINYQKIL